MELEAKAAGTDVQADGTAVTKFDATQYELLDFATMTVLDASRTQPMMYNGQPVTIDVWGPGSAEGVKQQHNENRTTALRTQAMFRGKQTMPSGAEQDRDRVVKGVAITKSVNNFPYEGGPTAIYRNPRFVYILNQLIDFYNDTSNFARPSTEN